MSDPRLAGAEFLHPTFLPRSCMRTILATTLALLLLPLATADPGSAGPFTGTIREHQMAHHHYDNNPENLICIQVIATYTVTLTYTPATDVLTLSAGGETA